MFIGSDGGNVYAVDRQTGCVHWSFLAGAGVRSAPLVIPHGKAGHAVCSATSRPTSMRSTPGPAP